MTDQDTQFIGVNYRQDPRSLPPGICAEAVNSRFTNGVAEQRRGMVATNWTRGAGGTYHNVYQPKGAAVFIDPNGVESIVMASGDGKVYATAPNNTAREVLMPAGETITGDVKFVQCFDTLVMLRGADHAPLALRSFNLGFEAIEQVDSVTGVDTENPLDGTEAIPNASEATFFTNRLLVVNGRDEIAASDYLNYTRYQPVFSSFRINQGNSGALVAIHPVDDNTLAVFKSDSIYLVSNVTGDLSAMKLDELTRNYGCAAAGSITKVGADIYFLSRRGVSSISITAQGHIQGVDVPLSADIQPLIDRIDWTRASTARGIYAHNRLYLAVPLSTEAAQKQYDFGYLNHDSGHLTHGTGDTDDLIVTYATEVSGNNAVLVYDFLTQKWAGVDVATGLSVKEWLYVQLSGTRRLCFMGNDGFVYLYDDPELCGFSDIRKHVVDDTGFDDYFSDYEVAFMVKTRAYGGSDVSVKQFNRVGFGVSTSNATLTVTASGNDGYNDDAVTTDLTRSRTLYIRPFDRTPFVATNVNGDHGVEGRGDYSVLTGDSGVVLEGVVLDQHQHFNERKLLRTSSNSCQLKIENASGNVRVDSVVVEYKPVEAFATAKT